MAGLSSLASDAKSLIGSEVTGLKFRGETLALRLGSRGTPDVLLIPAPWTFSSCLLAASSDSLDPDSESAAMLIGLDGARLTAVESCERSVDFVFDSIRISVFATK